MTAIAIFMCHPSAAFGQTTPQPNLILMMADDLGWVDVSVNTTNLNNASHYYETPSLEIMAAQGISFNNAYSAGPRCSPSRAAVLSGQYAPRSGNRVYGQRTKEEDVSLPLIGPVQGPGLPGSEKVNKLPESTITIADTLRNAGYSTAHFGKYHVGENTGPSAPHHRGFDLNIGGGSGGSTKSYHATFDEGFWQFGERVGPQLDAYAQPYTPEESQILTGSDVLAGKPKHITDAITDAVIDFIDNHKNKPLFLHIGQYAPHMPVSTTHARPDLLDKYNEKFDDMPDEEILLALNHLNPAYAALVDGFDQSIGMIMDYLNTTDDPRNPGHKLATNTLLVFYSDNGGLEQSTSDPTSNAPLRGQKGELYEGGIRTPMIAWSPGLIADAGTVSNTPVIGIDFYTTFSQLANATLPDNYPLDGQSLVPILLNADASLDRDAIFWHFPGYQLSEGRNHRPRSVIRSGDYKLLYNYEDKTIELYDLSSDLGETTNLFASKPHIVAQLRAQLMTWLFDVGADMPTVRGTGRPVTLPGLTEADLDGDQDLDDSDFTIFSNFFLTDFPGPSSYESYLKGDLDRDGLSTHADLLLFKGAFIDLYGSTAFANLVSAVAHPGDANLDGLIDISDLSILGANYELTDRLWTDADFTLDGIVDVADLSIIGANWSTGSTLSINLTPATNRKPIIPEPSSGILLAILALSLTTQRSHRTL